MIVPRIIFLSFAFSALVCIKCTNTTHNEAFIAEFNSILTKEYTNFDVPFHPLLAKVKDLAGPGGKKIVSILTILNDYRKSRHQLVSFIQIGANTGSATAIDNDKIQPLIFANDHWAGIAFEPVPPIYEEFSRNTARIRHRLEPVQAAVNTDKGSDSSNDRPTISIWHVDYDKYFKEHPGDKLPDFINQVASLDKNQVLASVGDKFVHKITSYIISTSVPLYSASDVIQKMSSFMNIAEVSGYEYAGGIDVLAVDIEGRDVDVLFALLREKLFRPLIIIFEIKHQSNQMNTINLLRKMNYSCMYSIFFREQNTAADAICVLLSSEVVSSDSALITGRGRGKGGGAGMGKRIGGKGKGKGGKRVNVATLREDGMRHRRLTK